MLHVKRVIFVTTNKAPPAGVADPGFPRGGVNPYGGRQHTI